MKRRLAQLWQPLGSLRYRLLALVLLPLLLLAATVIAVSARWSIDYTYQQLFTKVNTDLRVAHDSFLRIQNEQQRSIRAIVGNSIVAELMQKPEILNGWVAAQRREYGFDYLMLLSADGAKRLTSAGWVNHTLHESPLTDKALTTNSLNSGATGIEILPAAVWRSVGLLQPSHIEFSLIDTPRAAPTNRSKEDRAMIIRSLLAVHNAYGERLALLEGGRLLNRDFDFVDRIRDLVYGPGSLAPGSLGTVTVFLDDVRISTNVPLNDATRALGTRVSSEVRDTVLTRGESWTDRAFVVNDWYISAYDPIVDVNGDRVGMLYAGYLEAPFRNDLFNAITVLSGLVLAGCVLAIVGASIGARSIFRPIETLSSVVRATAAGKHRRVGSIQSVSEIGELSAQFDIMLDTLEQQRSKIEHGAHVLEDEVQNRTEELRQQNQRLTDSLALLKQTRKQLETAEKLAALGELTAGVAHEINNPTAVILGNMDILISEIGDSRTEVQTEIDLIIQQVYRIRSITHRLVQYSRSEYDPVSPITQTVSLPELVSSTVNLIRHDFVSDMVCITENHHCEHFVKADPNELQQVLVNLVRNAVEASESVSLEPTIEIATFDVDEREVAVSISDNGVGIESANLARIFDPFFTAGKEGGTGLGLSVSYGIVRRFGGRIDVTSKVGQGSTFTVVLPVASVADTTLDNSEHTDKALVSFDDVVAELNATKAPTAEID